MSDLKNTIEAFRLVLVVYAIVRNGERITMSLLWPKKLKTREIIDYICKVEFESYPLFTKEFSTKLAKSVQKFYNDEFNKSSASSHRKTIKYYDACIEKSDRLLKPYHGREKELSLKVRHFIGVIGVLKQEMTNHLEQLRDLDSIP